MSSIPTVDMDMATHLILERASFAGAKAIPTQASGGIAAGVIAAEAIPTERSPAAQAGLASGLMLALRFVQARCLSVWGLLVAAALCPAQAFADFALYSALANFAGIATLMRFEAVFFQNSDPARLGRAFRLALSAGIAFIVVTGVVVWMLGFSGWIVPTYGLLFLISLAGRAAIRLISSEATAEADFRAIGNSNIVQALVQPGMMILLIWPLGATSLALFAADAIGHVVSALYLARRRRASLVRLVGRHVWSLTELRLSALRWRSAPMLLLPSALLSFGFMIIPLLALPYAASPLLAAHVALAMRLLEVPTQMFSAVSVPLILSSLRARTVENRQNWVRIITLGLLAAAAVLFAAIAVVAMGADVVLDGTQWEGIGEVVAIMALFYGSIALVTPLHEIAALSRHPRRQVVTNGLALLAAGAVIAVVGTLSPALLFAIGLVSVMRMAAHIQFAWTRFGHVGQSAALGGRG